jgi:(p)ppGpp synthase/HD superfamily hydrolase
MKNYTQTNENDLLVLAKRIIENSFADKKDKGGQPYIYHLFRVSNKVPTTYGNVLKIVALLHDLLEDCPEWTDKALLTLFPKEIVDRVVILTRIKNESYDDYIDRIIKDNTCCVIKKADLEDNMDLTRLNEITENDIDRIKKYHKAYVKILTFI